MAYKPFYVDGERVPGVTTIISRFKNADPLIYWAWELGKNGGDLREARKGAKDAGSAFHARIEAKIRGKEPDFQGFDRKAIKDSAQAFEGFETWTAQNRLQVVTAEERILSTKHKFGCIIDAVVIGNQLGLLDWKSGKGTRVYLDDLLQLAANMAAWEENRPDQPLEGGAHLIRFDRNSLRFSHHHFGAKSKEIKEAWRAFQYMRKLYPIVRTLEKSL